MLTHWGRVTHTCVGNLTIIGPDNGLSPGRHQAIIWTNPGTLMNKLQWNFNRYSNIFIQENAFENVVCEMASILPQPQCVKLSAVKFKLVELYVEYNVSPWVYVEHGIYVTVPWFCIIEKTSGGTMLEDIRPKLISNSNLAKSHGSVTSLSVF